MLGLQDGQRPADAVHVLLARRGRGRRSCWRAASARGRSARTPVYLRSVAFRTRRFGSFEVFSPSIPLDGRAVADRRGRRGRVRAGGHRPRRRRRRAAPGHRVGRRGHAPGRDRLLRARRAGAADPERRDATSAAGCRSTPTAAASPTASRSAPPACARSTRSSLQLRGEAGERQVAGPARVGFTQVYGAPGVSACTVLSR